MKYLHLHLNRNGARGSSPRSIRPRVNFTVNPKHIRAKAADACNRALYNAPNYTLNELSRRVVGDKDRRVCFSRMRFPLSRARASVVRRSALSTYLFAHALFFCDLSHVTRSYRIFARPPNPRRSTFRKRKIVYFHTSLIISVNRFRRVRLWRVFSPEKIGIRRTKKCTTSLNGTVVRVAAVCAMVCGLVAWKWRASRADSPAKIGI